MSFFKRKISNTINVVKNFLHSSFAIMLCLYLLFLPFFAIRWYIRLMFRKPLRFFLLNIVGVMVVLIYILTCYITLPGIEKIYNYRPILTSKFYDANNELIYEIGSEKRTHIDIEQVPKMLIYAFISAEDKTFYTNPGFDLVGLTRTIAQDFLKILHGQKLSGASTITQQVVKNILLSQERTITRKIKELILSYQLSKVLSKDAIMEIYLNHIYLGMQAYGIVSASEEYFGKTVSQITIPEMALLAAMPKAPSAINPFKNYNRAVARRNWVLLRMLEDGYITQDQYEQFSKEELIIKKRHNTYAPFYAPSFFARSLLTANTTGLTKENLLRDGYKVQLTIDGELQKIAQNALNHSLENYAKKHGYTGPLYSFAENETKIKTPNELLKSVDEPENINHFTIAVVLSVQQDKAIIGFNDNSKGTILLDDLQWARRKISEIEIDDKKITKCTDVLHVGDVIVVSRKTEDSEYYSLEQIPQINGSVLAMNPKTGAILAMVGGYADLAGSLNRSVQSFRQMGSIIKPFVYGTALENGFSPASIFMDTDVSMNVGDGVIWNPTNDNKKTNGPTTLRVGLEKSRNTVTIRIADAVGLTKIRKKIIKSGLNSNPENNLAITIGSIESSLINIATAYSAFANDGKLPKPYIISYVKNVMNTERKNVGNREDQNGNIFDKIFFKNCDVNAKCEITIEDQEKHSNGSINNGNTDSVNDGNINDKQTKVAENDGILAKSDISEANDTEYISDADITAVIKEATNSANNTDVQSSNDKQEEQNNYKDNNDKGVKDKGNNIDNLCLFTPEVAYQVINILQGAVKYGTSRKLNNLDLPIASKTGTSNQGKDLWNIVISPELVIVAYVGYDIPMETNNFGAQYALPINYEILANLPEKYKINDFKTPKDIKFIKIDHLTGRLAPPDDDHGDNVIFEAFKQNDEIPTEYNVHDTEDKDIDLTDL